MNRTDKSRLCWHPSLKSTFRSCKDWMETTGLTSLSESEVDIDQRLSAPGKLCVTTSIYVGLMGHALAVEACSFKANSTRDILLRHIQWAVSFYDLAFRFDAFTSMHSEDQYLNSFRSSMKVAGSVMLSHWEDAAASARLLIDVAHNDQKENVSVIRRAGWGKGTHTTFLIYLLSDAFEIPTHYQPVAPFLPAYEHLLDVWRTTDESAFREAMLPAIEFHISRGKYSTERNDYEFDHPFHRVYPAELLAVQALRRRDGLPEFQAGHLLVDTPWSIIRDAEPVEPHPLFVAIQDRMRQDYPGFV